MSKVRSIGGKEFHNYTSANITTVFKKSNKNCPTNYRLISLTSVCYKTLEHHFHSIMEHLQNNNLLNRVLIDNQRGFRAGYSCQSQLISLIQDLLHACYGQSLSKAAAYIRTYVSLVRPLMEYASIVWEPHQMACINSLERIQHRAARWATSNYIAGLTVLYCYSTVT